MRFEALRERCPFRMACAGWSNFSFYTLYKISGLLVLKIQGKVRVSTVHKTHDYLSSFSPASLKTRPITIKSCHVHHTHLFT